MTADINTLKQITLGAIRIEENNGYFSFHRFTENQEKIISERIGSSRLSCTSTIKLEFYTKGGEISFDYKITPGTKREYYSIDVLVDKIYKYNISEEKAPALGKFYYEIPTSQNYQRVTVYFPTTAMMEITNLCIPEDFQPHKRTKKLLFLGCSMLQGYYPNHFQNTFANILADYYDAEAINQAIGGDCFNVTNLEKLDIDPEFILLSFGVNDWASGRFKNGEEADSYLTQLKKMWNDIPAFQLIPPRLSHLEKTRKNDDLLYHTDTESKQTLDDVREIMVKLSEKHNIHIINSKDFVPEYSECFYADNVHFTDLGNVIFADKLIAEINKVI